MNKWDERYLGEDYVFGTEPNGFLYEAAPFLPKRGRALDWATGEGRNGIFLASLGLDVLGIDLSAVGLRKAQRLAAEKQVAFAVEQADLTRFAMPPDTYAVISSVFCHFAEPQRSLVAQKAVAALQSGGCFVGVFYHPDQIALGTGGPSDPAMLGTLAQMQQAFDGLQWLIAEERRHILHEGSRHHGESALVCLLGRKP